jgi:hypothetical protein
MFFLSLPSVWVLEIKSFNYVLLTPLPHYLPVACPWVRSFVSAFQILITISLAAFGIILPRSCHLLDSVLITLPSRRRLLHLLIPFPDPLF